jgi:nucleotide-binding universal stress UspA family protein
MIRTTMTEPTTTETTWTGTAGAEPVSRRRQRIVVGVDGSPSSVEALRWAEFLAQQIDADVEAVTTWEAPIGWQDEGWIDDTDPRDEARRQLRTAVRTVYGRNRPAHLSTSVLLDSPVTALLTAGRTATLMVVGSRGHGRMAGLLLGSVSSAVAAKAACPVVVVHGQTVPG